LFSVANSSFEMPPDLLTVYVASVERTDEAHARCADFLALRGEADAHRAAIDARALMIEEAEFNQLSSNC